MGTDRLRWIYRAYRYRYKLEKQEIRLLLDHLAPGDVAVDVGAHKGAYTYWMRKAVGDSGRVFAFEPQPMLARRLQALAGSGGLDNVVVENLGVSSSAGTMLLNVPGTGSSPGASLEPGLGGDHAQRYPVKVVTLDDYFEHARADRIRLIKCDAEGHELEVFRGGEQLLKTARPALLFECERRHRASGSVEEVFSYLETLGFRGFFVDRDGLKDISGFEPGRHQVEGSSAYINNFLFIADTEREAG